MTNSTLTPGVIKQEWAQAADCAKEAATSVSAIASRAGSAVGALASQAVCDVGSIASQAACDVGKKADDLTASAGIGIQGLGDRISKTAPRSGVVGNATQAVAGAVRNSGEYLEGAKFGGMTEDVAQLIRRNPFPAVFIAIGLGWFVARKLRS